MNPETVDKLRQVIENYSVEGRLTEAEECVTGHINETYHVILTQSDGIRDELVIQKINSYVFKEPVKVMHNIREIRRHLEEKKSECECEIISFLDNMEGKNYTVIDGEYWRVCRFIENSFAPQQVKDEKVLYSAGYAFGRFQSILSDLPMENLHVTIPDFHNTKKRLHTLFKTAEKDPLGRAKEVEVELDFFREHRELACRLCEMKEKGELPLRVTHNDTKYNNILMDRETCEPLCIIDLDTVMPGLAVHDFGDAVRFAANQAREDETDLSLVGLDLNYYREFTKGYMQVCQNLLTRSEVETLALGCIVITLELSSRFLADYINGDKYFRIERESHNLDRARCQIELANDMLDKYDLMCGIVEEYMEKKSFEGMATGAGT